MIAATRRHSRRSASFSLPFAYRLLNVGSEWGLGLLVGIAPPVGAPKRIPGQAVGSGSLGCSSARLRGFFEHRDDVIFEDHLGLPDAVYVAALAATKEPSPKGEYPAPIYIHPPYAKLPGPVK